MEGSTTAKSLDGAKAPPRSSHFCLFAARMLGSGCGFGQVVTIVADVVGRNMRLHRRDCGVANHPLGSQYWEYLTYQRRRRAAPGAVITIATTTFSVAKSVAVVAIVTGTFATADRQHPRRIVVAVTVLVAVVDLALGPECHNLSRLALSSYSSGTCRTYGSAP